MLFPVINPEVYPGVTLPYIHLRYTRVLHLLIYPEVYPGRCPLSLTLRYTLVGMPPVQPGYRTMCTLVVLKVLRGLSSPPFPVSLLGKSFPSHHPFHCWARIALPTTRFTVGLDVKGSRKACFSLPGWV